jgi:hypothetical protein
VGGDGRACPASAHLTGQVRRRAGGGAGDLRLHRIGQQRPLGLPSFGAPIAGSFTFDSAGRRCHRESATRLACERRRAVRLRGERRRHALSSVALPVDPPSLAAFAVRGFRLFGPDVEFLGTVNTLVCSTGCTPTSVP